VNQISKTLRVISNLLLFYLSNDVVSIIYLFSGYLITLPQLEVCNAWDESRRCSHKWQGDKAFEQDLGDLSEGTIQELAQRD
jgi:hypothetical protein